jgi:hypothetical protein
MTASFRLPGEYFRRADGVAELAKQGKSKWVASRAPLDPWPSLTGRSVMKNTLFAATVRGDIPA